jgi:hypothetical protein
MSRRHGRSRHHGRPRLDGAPQAALDASAPRPTSLDARPPEPVLPPAAPAEASHVAGGSAAAVVSAPPPPPAQPVHPNGGQLVANGCTAPQLRRFIKSRPYVPMHELRRRFGIDGQDDDVTQVPMDGGAIYVGLPHREGTLLGDLLRGGEIGYELSLDPRTPIVVGVYPMRPVPRS